jgi:hypothetical protein
MVFTYFSAKISEQLRLYDRSTWTVEPTTPFLGNVLEHWE